MARSRDWRAGILAATFATLTVFAGPDWTEPPATASTTTTAHVTAAPPPVTIANAIDPLAGIPGPDQTYVPGDCASMFGLAMQAGWTWAEWPRLAATSARETGCHPNPPCPMTRRGPVCPEWWSDYGNSYGITQLHVRGRLWWAPINSREPRSMRELCSLYPGELADVEAREGTAAAKERLREPYRNLMCAKRLHDARGWAPWE